VGEKELVEKIRHPGQPATGFARRRESSERPNTIRRLST
jgi:hypothetical protein